jgi:membrane associated rhomboid family serine protease
MPGASHTIREEIHGIVAFVAVIWAVFAVSCFFPAIRSFGLVPCTLRGLVGILTMPFLHAGFHHLLSNTLPLVVLLALLAGSQARSWQVVVEVALLGGGLLWIFGRHADHIGASGLIFGLVTFLILSGLLEKRAIPLLVSLLVGFLYGGTLFWGVLPQGDGISLDGHLCGAVAGAIVAYALTRSSTRDRASGTSGA